MSTKHNFPRDRGLDPVEKALLLFIGISIIAALTAEVLLILGVIR